MAKKITKSVEHCKALIQRMLAIRVEYCKALAACNEDATAGPDERAADIALFERKKMDVDRMVRWWEADIARHEAKAEAAKVVVETPAEA